MSEKMILKLVPESEAQEQRKRRSRLPVVIIGLVLLSLMIGVGLGKSLWPVMPDDLTPTEAARILQMSKGYAGYTLVKEDGGNGQVGHAIFCPTCATEIAMVNVSFLPPAPPEPGSRMAILMNLAKYATAPAVAKTKKPATAPAPVVTVQ
jgi:hypothetical protein